MLYGYVSHDPQDEELCPRCHGDDWCRHCRASGVVSGEEARAIRKDMRNEYLADHGPDDDREIDESRLP